MLVASSGGASPSASAMDSNLNKYSALIRNQVAPYGVRGGTDAIRHLMESKATRLLSLAGNELVPTGMDFEYPAFLHFNIGRT